MGAAAKIAFSAATLLGAAMFSQAPEFAQQYRQRLGGALDELSAIVADFDTDAGDRDAALSIYDASKEPFLAARGQSMRRTIARHETLERQSDAFLTASPFERPIVLVRWADRQIFAHAWREFLPAFPLTTEGLVWGSAGGGLAASLLAALRGVIRLARRGLRPASRPK